MKKTNDMSKLIPVSFLADTEINKDFKKALQEMSEQSNESIEKLKKHCFESGYEGFHK